MTEVWLWKLNVWFAYEVECAVCTWRWNAGFDIHYGRHFGLRRGSNVGRSGVFQRTFLVGDGGGVFRSGFCAGGRQYLLL